MILRKKLDLGKKLGLAGLLALGSVSAASANVVALDTFDYTPVITLEANAGTIQDSTIRNDVNSFLGDVKYTLDYISGPGALDSSSVSFDISGDGVMSYSNDDSMVSSLTMLYSTFNGTPDSPLDLTLAGSQSAFYFDILSSDLGFTIDVTVGSDFGTNVSGYMSTSSSVNSLTREFIDFTSFNTLSGTGVNFSAVEYVSILLTTTAIGSDLSITEFGVTSVPEPTSVAIFGLGLVGFALSRKKVK
jgi:hypothetical protein